MNDPVHRNVTKLSANGLTLTNTINERCNWSLDHGSSLDFKITDGHFLPSHKPAAPMSAAACC